MFSFATEKAIGQTITLTVPTRVCSGLKFNLIVSSSDPINVRLDISTDGGQNWVPGNQFSGTDPNLTTGLNDVTFYNLNITRTTLYRIGNKK